MKIVLCGGGSGGHITPLLAVAYELKQLQPDVQIIYIGQQGDKLHDVAADNPNIDAAYSIRAGKLRRYHGARLKQLVDLPMLAKNVRDSGRVVAGYAASYRLLKKLRPDVIFIKGGYVGVPVGLAAAQLHIPYITHDSDAVPGLANRLIARWAHLHAVALPKAVYDYPPDKTVVVGVPIGHEYQPLRAEGQRTLREQLGLEKFRQVVLVTGGGNGAQRLNEAIVRLAPHLLTTYPRLALVHITGRAHEASVGELYKDLLSADQRPRVIVKGFVQDFYRYSGAADVIVARAGATNIAEFAAQAKACILVPNPYLTNGHQLKNAEHLAEREAVRIVDEANLADGEALLEAIKSLLEDSALRARLGANLHKLAKPDAARLLAQLLLK